MPGVLRELFLLLFPIDNRRQEDFLLLFYYYYYRLGVEVEHDAAAPHSEAGRDHAGM